MVNDYVSSSKVRFRRVEEAPAQQRKPCLRSRKAVKRKLPNFYRQDCLSMQSTTTSLRLQTISCRWWWIGLRSPAIPQQVTKRSIRFSSSDVEGTVRLRSRVETLCGNGGAEFRLEEPSWCWIISLCVLERTLRSAKPGEVPLRMKKSQPGVKMRPNSLPEAQKDVCYSPHTSVDLLS